MYPPLRLLPLIALTASCVDSPGPPPPSPAAATPEPAPARVDPAPAPPPAAGRVSAMSLETFFAMQQAGEVLIYDARPSFVHAFGAIPGAINWPESAYDKQLGLREPEIRAAVAAGKTVVIYCTDAHCPDARKVADRLAARGHDVAVFEGGYAEWKEAGLDLES